MDVIITGWALDSYISLKASASFTDHEYRSTLRPDAELLKGYPKVSKFTVSKFWGPATFKGFAIPYGHKMKWHNFGNGNLQLRLCVVIISSELNDEVKERAFLCTGYVKDDKSDKREMARLKIKIAKILDGTYEYRGEL